MSKVCQDRDSVFFRESLKNGVKQGRMELQFCSTNNKVIAAIGHSRHFVFRAQCATVITDR